MLWFNFILGLIFISLCFKLIIIYYHAQKQREIKIKPRINARDFEQSKQGGKTIEMWWRKKKVGVGSVWGPCRVYVGSIYGRCGRG